MPSRFDPDDFDRSYDRSLEREPTYGARPLPRLDPRGTVKQRFAPDAPAADLQITMPWERRMDGAS